MQKVLITAIIVSGIVALAMIGNNVSPKEVVFEMCQASRIHNSVSEETCGDLQAHYGFLYTCEERNSLTTNKCWTEAW